MPRKCHKPYKSQEKFKKNLSLTPLSRQFPTKIRYKKPVVEI